VQWLQVAHEKYYYTYERPLGILGQAVEYSLGVGGIDPFGWAELVYLLSIFI